MQIPKILAIFLAVVYSFALANASFQIGNGTRIEQSYSPGDSIRGKLNLSFQNHQSDLNLESNFGQGVSLLDFLKANKANFTCSPADCKNGYTKAVAGETWKIFQLKTGETKLVSFLIEDANISSITSLKINADVKNSKSCMIPLEIDVLDDGAVDLRSTNQTQDDFCTVDLGTGCFMNSGDYDEVLLSSSSQYCEKIKLGPITAGNSFLAGAWVKKEKTTNANVLMRIFSLAGSKIGECTIAAGEISELGESVSCLVKSTSSSSEIKDYYVCASSSSEGDFSTQKENSEPCGFSTGNTILPNPPLTIDFNIFGKSPKYGNTGNYKIERTESSQTLAITNYIKNKYNGNCASGCVIPIKFRANENLDINLSSPELVYKMTNLLTAKTIEIRETDFSSASVNSGFVMLDLAYSGINVPERETSENFVLQIGNDSAASSLVTVRGNVSSFSLFPTIVAAGNPTEFRLDGGKNISNYAWNFGDSTSSITTTANSAEHTYSTIGEYSLVLELQQGTNKITKTFKISVVNPREQINYTLADYYKKLDKIDKTIESFPSWYKSSIEKSLNLKAIKDSIDDLKNKYKTAGDAEMIGIMNELSKISVPEKLETIELDSPYYASPERIKPEFLDEWVSGYQAGQEESYKKEIARWSSKNLEMRLKIKYINANYDSGIATLFSFVTLKITPKETFEYPLYLVVEGNSVFKETAKEFENAAGLRVTESMNNIEFLLEGRKDISNLNLYLSPELSELDVAEESYCNYDNECDKSSGESFETCPSDCKRTGRAIFYVFLVIIAAFLIYIVLYWWYKTRYENHLFKNRANLFNIINFITMNLNKGMNKEEIKSKLKQSGWKGEQISYAFKKVESKRIMPFDFSFLNKLFERKKQAL